MVYGYCIDRLINDAETAETMAVRHNNPEFNAIALYSRACVVLKQRGVSEEHPIVLESERAYESVFTQTSSGSNERLCGLVHATVLLLKALS